MDINNLAPIVLFCYNRPWHTEQTLDALMLNELSDKSTLYIFVDGPKLEASQIDKEQIKTVREIVKKKQWCKTVNISISESNISCRQSVINGITNVLANHNSVIVLEDDIVTSPYFLNYMNKALLYYENRKSVFSISANSPPPDKVLIPDNYKYDVYASPRIFNWGWGTWSDRWKQTEWDKSFIPDFAKKEYEVEAFHRGGADMLKMLIDEYDGKTDVWDAQYSYHHFANYALSIVPCVSYTRNIGLDGSGTHCGVVKDDKTDISMAKKNPVFLDVLYLDKRIINSISSYFYPRKRPIWKKIINRLSRAVGYKNIFVIKKKVFH